MINCKNKTIQEVAEIITALKQQNYTVEQIENILVF